MIRSISLILAAATALSACVPEVETTRIEPLDTPLQVNPDGPACLGRAVTPALIETVTEQVMVQPAQVEADGTVVQPAVFRTMTRQQILRERREVEFEAPCPADMTVQFIASVQRALKVRGHYRGQITGVLDDRTGRAIRDFQVANGDHDTPILTLTTARALGLVALDRAALEAE